MYLTCRNILADLVSLFYVFLCTNEKNLQIQFCQFASA